MTVRSRLEKWFKDNHDQRLWVSAYLQQKGLTPLKAIWGHQAALDHLEWLLKSEPGHRVVNAMAATWRQKESRRKSDKKPVGFSLTPEANTQFKKLFRESRAVGGPKTRSGYLEKLIKSEFEGVREAKRREAAGKRQPGPDDQITFDRLRPGPPALRDAREQIRALKTSQEAWVKLVEELLFVNLKLGIFLEGQSLIAVLNNDEKLRVQYEHVRLMKYHRKDINSLVAKVAKVDVSDPAPETDGGGDPQPRPDDSAAP